MKTPDEIRGLKKEIRLLKSRVKKIEKAYDQLKMQMKKFPGAKRNGSKNLGYYNWLENEKRLRNLLNDD